jgi:DNA (cytosine-5)-methyltransferase 1
MKALSLFANIGAAEAYLKEIGVDVKVANELVKRRADLYSAIYPDTEMICGDITDKNIFNKILDKSLKNNIEIVMATPPCQGMSTAGQQLKGDKRNELIIPVLKMVKKIKPKYIFIENVPMFLKTEINYNDSKILIPDLIKKVLGKDYHIEISVVDTKDYEVPQMRERAIILLSSKLVETTWHLPSKSDKVVTLKDAIGDLPEVDPFIKDISKEELLKMFPDYEKKKKQALEISKWNNPPHHIKRQVEVMRYTPSGCSAFANKKHKPVKEDGTFVKGYFNTYKRQNWDTPAYTVTMDNRKISS